MNVTIQRADRLRGSVAMPGDKSIAHRALILGSLARGTQAITGLPASQDVASTAACLRSLGCAIEENGSGHVLVKPGAWQSGVRIDAGNSGTTARLLSGLIAGVGIDCTIDGDDSLRRRPMERVAAPLREMGASFETAPGGCLPMQIRGAPLQGITYRSPVASAQVKSAILIAGLNAQGRTTVVEKAPTRDHTENMLTAMSVPVEREGRSVSVAGTAELHAVHVTVPGDISSAAFFLAAASIVPGSEVVLRGTGVNATRCGVLDVLAGMGSAVSIDGEKMSAGERIADLIVRHATLHGTEIQGEIIPRLIDELPVLAVVASQAEGTTTVRGAAELRHKESDRIRTVVDNLSRMGADIEELEDGFVVRGPCSLRGATVSSYGDHRIAMAMTVAGLVADGETIVEDCGAVSVSYPEFFHDLKALTAGQGA